MSPPLPPGAMRQRRRPAGTGRAGWCAARGHQAVDLDLRERRGDVGAGVVDEDVEPTEALDTWSTSASAATASPTSSCQRTAAAPSSGGITPRPSALSLCRSDVGERRRARPRRPARAIAAPRPLPRRSRARPARQEGSRRVQAAVRLPAAGVVAAWAVRVMTRFRHMRTRERPVCGHGVTPRRHGGRTCRID